METVLLLCMMFFLIYFGDQELHMQHINKCIFFGINCSLNAHKCCGKKYIHIIYYYSIDILNELLFYLILNVV